MVAALVDAPAQTKTYDGSTIESGVRARAESILTALGYGTFGRYEIEQRVGGNPSGNDADRLLRRGCRDDERSLIETVSPGSSDKLLAQLQAGDAGHRRPGRPGQGRHARQPDRQAAGPDDHPAHQGRPAGARAERDRLRDRVVAARRARTADLVQLYTQPPDDLRADTGAPYGAGHCNFTTDAAGRCDRAAGRLGAQRCGSGDELAL